MIYSPVARFLIALLAALLLIPVLLIPAQDTQVLEQFHNRRLRTWPAPDLFVEDPAAWFRKARGWMADRAFPIVQASVFQKHFLLYALHTAPQRRVTLGKDGFVFLNGTSEDEIDVLLDSTCKGAHSEPVRRAFEDALVPLAAFSRSRKIPIDIVLFPTLASLYGDRLPLSVPRQYRDACLEITHGHAPLLGAQRTGPVSVYYPLLEMLAARDDEAFFPKANWHADGLSLKVARDAYLARRGIAVRPPETLELGSGPSEILSTYGIIRNYPVYFVHNPFIQPNLQRNAAFSQGVAHLFRAAATRSQAFDNARALLGESVLMISDSYGDRAGGVFAGAFEKMQQVTTNDMDESKLLELIDRASRLAPIDRLILLVTEGNTSRVVTWSKALTRAPG